MPLKKSPIKYAGGKSWLVPKLAQYFSAKPYDRLVEPFVGGASVALGLQPKSAYLCDINPHLINFYRWLQIGLIIDLYMDNTPECYYAYRDRFNYLIEQDKAESREAAQLFYYLNKQGFNGLSRYNNKGLFNVPCGNYKRLNAKQDLMDYQKLLKNWVFECRSYEDLVLDNLVSSKDLVYADPPYDDGFIGYSKEKFSWADRVALACWLETLDCDVIVSDKATNRVLKLYKYLGFEIQLIDAPRRISCNGDRTPVSEMLATIIK